MAQDETIIADELDEFFGDKTNEQPVEQTAVPDDAQRAESADDLDLFFPDGDAEPDITIRADDDYTPPPLRDFSGDFRRGFEVQRARDNYSSHRRAFDAVVDELENDSASRLRGVPLPLIRAYLDAEEHDDEASKSAYDVARARYSGGNWRSRHLGQVPGKNDPEGVLSAYAALSQSGVVPSVAELWERAYERIERALDENDAELIDSDESLGSALGRAGGWISEPASWVALAAPIPSLAPAGALAVVKYAVASGAIAGGEQAVVEQANKDLNERLGRGNAEDVARRILIALGTGTIFGALLGTGIKGLGKGKDALFLKMGNNEEALNGMPEPVRRHIRRGIERAQEKVIRHRAKNIVQENETALSLMTQNALRQSDEEFRIVLKETERFPLDSAGSQAIRKSIERTRAEMTWEYNSLLVIRKAAEDDPGDQVAQFALQSARARLQQIKAEFRVVSEFNELVKLFRDAKQNRKADPARYHQYKAAIERFIASKLTRTHTAKGSLSNVRNAEITEETLRTTFQAGMRDVYTSVMKLNGLNYSRKTMLGIMNEIPAVLSGQKTNSRYGKLAKQVVDTLVRADKMRTARGLLPRIRLDKDGNPTNPADFFPTGLEHTRVASVSKQDWIAAVRKLVRPDETIAALRQIIARKTGEQDAFPHLDAITGGQKDDPLASARAQLRQADEYLNPKPAETHTGDGAGIAIYANRHTPNKALDDALGWLYDEITGGADSAIPVAVPNAHRALEFKNINSAMEFSRQFGAGDNINLLTQFDQKLRRFSQEIALAEIFGDTAGNATKGGYQNFKNIYAETMKNEFRYSQTQVNSILTNKADAAMDVATGAINRAQDGYEAVANAMSFARNTTTMALLGKIIALMPVEYVRSALKAARLGATSGDVAKMLAKDIAWIFARKNKPERELVENLFTGLDYSVQRAPINSRFVESEGKRSAGAVDKFFRITTMNRLTNIHQVVVAHSHWSFLTHFIKRLTDDDLANPAFIAKHEKGGELFGKQNIKSYGDTLARSGITTGELKRLKSLSDIDEMPLLNLRQLLNRKGKTAEQIFADTNLFHKIQDMFKREQLQSVNFPDFQTRATTSGGKQRGTLVGETMRSGTQFLSVPIQMARTSWSPVPYRAMRDAPWGNKLRSAKEGWQYASLNDTPGKAIGTAAAIAFLAYVILPITQDATRGRTKRGDIDDLDAWRDYFVPPGERGAENRDKAFYAVKKLSYAQPQGMFLEVPIDTVAYGEAPFTPAMFGVAADIGKAAVPDKDGYTDKELERAIHVLLKYVLPFRNAPGFETAYDALEYELIPRTTKKIERRREKRQKTMGREDHRRELRKAFTDNVVAPAMDAVNN